MKILNLIFLILFSLQGFSDTFRTDLSNSEWTEITSTEQIGYITNPTGNRILFKEASIKPDDSDTEGHTLNGNADRSYSINPDQKLFARGTVEHGSIYIQVTPGANFSNNVIGSVTGDLLTPYETQIALNRIVGTGDVDKFGENPDIDTSSGFETIWDAGGIYVPPTEARLHDIASTNIEDDGDLLSSGTADSGTANTITDLSATFQTDLVAAGDFVLNDTGMNLGRILSVPSETTIVVVRWAEPIKGNIVSPPSLGDSYRVVTSASTGAGIMYILGLDSTFLEISEFIILNGTTNVPTLLSYIRQFRARVFLEGGAGGAVGIITSTAQTDGTVSLQIINGNNQTLMAVFTIPFNKIGVLTSWWGDISKKQTSSSTIRLRAGELSGVSYILQTRGINSSGSSDFSYTFPIPRTLPGGADIFMEGDSSANDVGLSGGFFIELQDL